MKNLSPVRAISQRATRFRAARVSRRPRRRFALPVVMLSILVVYGTPLATPRSRPGSGDIDDPFLLAAAGRTRTRATMTAWWWPPRCTPGSIRKRSRAGSARIGRGSTRPTAFISVCLGVLQKQPKVERELKESSNGSQRDGLAAASHSDGCRRAGLHEIQLVHPLGDEAHAAKAGGDTERRDYVNLGGALEFSVQLPTVEARKAGVAPAAAVGFCP